MALEKLTLRSVTDVEEGLPHLDESLQLIIVEVAYQKRIAGVSPRATCDYHVE